MPSMDERQLIEVLTILRPLLQDPSLSNEQIVLLLHAGPLAERLGYYQFRGEDYLELVRYLIERVIELESSSRQLRQELMGYLREDLSHVAHA